MKDYADATRHDAQYAVGNLVYLKLRPYRRKSVALHRNEKLYPRYYRPFEIVARVGPVAYKLRLPKPTSMHPVFHVSQLRKAIGTAPSSFALLQ